jgi:HAD superfamily hydrolase (TIGR01509 family)
VTESPQALFLDFDGVVCDTERAARRSWEELYAVSRVKLPEEIWTRMMGSSNGAEIARRYLADRRGVEVRREELTWRLGRKQALADQEPLRPGVADLVTNAVRLGIPVAVVSSSPASWVEPHLARLGLRRMVSFAVTGDEVLRTKPAPDLYLLALARADMAADQVLAIEDSAPGIRAAKLAGVRCVAFPNQSGALRESLGADVMLESLRHLELTVPKPTAPADRGREVSVGDS